MTDGWLDDGSGELKRVTFIGDSHPRPTNPAGRTESGAEPAGTGAVGDGERGRSRESAPATDWQTIRDALTSAAECDIEHLAPEALAAVARLQHQHEQTREFLMLIKRRAAMGIVTTQSEYAAALARLDEQEQT